MSSTTPTTRRTRGGWVPAGTSAARRTAHASRTTAKGQRTREELVAAARRNHHRGPSGRLACRQKRRDGWAVNAGHLEVAVIFVGWLVDFLGRLAFRAGGSVGPERNLRMVGGQSQA